MAFPSTTVTVPSLQDWQMSYNGLTIGAGTPYVLQHAQGLSGPKIRSQDEPRARDLGSYIGFDVYGSRTFNLSLFVVSDGTNSLETLLYNLATAFAPQPNNELPFYIKLPTLPQLAIMSRVKRREYPIDLAFGAAQTANVALQLESTDPILYEAPTQSVNSGLGAPSITTGFPITFPMNFASSAYNGATNLLSPDDASFQGSIGTWQPNTNCTLAQNTSVTLNGTNSLAITAVSAGHVRAQTPYGANPPTYPAQPNTTYTFIVSIKAGSTARVCQASIEFAAGTPTSPTYTSVLSPAITNSTSNWTQLVVSFTSPANAIGVDVQVHINNAAAGEVHYISEVALYQSAASPNLVPDTTDLGTWSLANASNDFSIVPSLLGGDQFQVLGNGSSQSGYVVSQIFAISPGTHNLSLYIDGTYLVGSGGTVAIWNPTITTSYSKDILLTNGFKGTANATVTIPSGVSKAVFVINLGGNTITSGQSAIFAQPQLTLGSTTQSYAPGQNWVQGQTQTVGVPIYISINNSGNYNVRPIITFTGPLTNPYVSNTTITGNPKLSFTNPTQTGYTLNAGDTLTIDTDAHTIIYTPYGSSFGANYRSWLVFGSTWFDLVPGQNNLYFGSSDTTLTSGTITIQWANGYEL